MTTLLPRPGAELTPSAHQIELVVSDRADDIDDALAVVHDGFVESGFIARQPSGRRFHPSYLNPGTIFAVARIDGEPIGAAVMVPDGPFGLPSDRAFAEELDALRAGCAAPIRECGSFAVLAPWRRHTRRVFIRILAAFTRIAIAEFPDAPGIMTVSPETERFYRDVGGFTRLAGPRPLFGAPALLMLTPNAVEASHHHLIGTTQSQRTISRLTRDPDPRWMVDIRDHLPLPADWLRALAGEQLSATPIGAQLRLLTECHPQILRALTSPPTRPLFA